MASVGWCSVPDLKAMALPTGEKSTWSIARTSIAPVSGTALMNLTPASGGKRGSVTLSVPQPRSAAEPITSGMKRERRISNTPEEGCLLGIGCKKRKISYCPVGGGFGVCLSGPPFANNPRDAANAVIAAAAAAITRAVRLREKRRSFASCMSDALMVKGSPDQRLLWPLK